MAFQTQQSGQLYPNLGQQQQQQIALRPSGVSAAQITQDDLDRVWKPIFENYHGGEGCCEGCTTRRLRIPLSSLKDLLATLPTDDAEKQQQSQLQMSRRNQSRFAHIERSGGGHIPMPRWVLELVTKQADVDRDGWVDYDEFCDIILQNKQDLTSTHLTGLEKFVQDSVNSVTPAYYDEYYGRCCPPPLFIPLISLAEVAVFIWYCVEMCKWGANEPVPVYSPLIFDPKRRTEAWRFVSYMLLHAGIVHIAMNILIQLLLGIPLELVHKGWRIMLVYILGALIGGLAHSVTDFETMLCGASGGVYALIGAHVANVLMNFKEMRFGIVRSIILGVLIVADVSLALYKRYGTAEKSKVGYMAHLGGFIGGLFLGIVCLKNLKVRSWERVIWYIALVVILIMMLIAVLVNTFYAGYPDEDKRYLEEYYASMKKLYGPKDC